MKIIKPHTIAEANITATNIPDDVVYDNATAYTVGDTVLYTADTEELLWQCSADTTGNAPETGSAFWFNIGPAKKLCPFDLQVGVDQYRVIETVATHADSITYTIEALERVTGIYMEGLVADNVAITAVQDGVTELDTSYDMQDRTQYNGSFYRWYYMPISIEDTYTDTEMNIPAGATFNITITKTGDTAEVATIVLGLVEEYESTRIGATRSISSRSVKKAEGLVNSLKRRLPSKKVSYPVIVQNYEGHGLMSLLDDIDGTTAVFIADESRPELTVFGFHTSANMTADALGVSEFTIEVQSL